MVHISDLVNKSKRISGFAYPYLPILVNISDKHALPSLSQKHLVKPSYCTATVVIVFILPIILESMDLVHIHVSAVNWPDQKWGVHVLFSPHPPPIKYKVEPHLRTPH